VISLDKFLRKNFNQNKVLLLSHLTKYFFAIKNYLVRNATINIKSITPKIPIASKLSGFLVFKI